MIFRGKHCSLSNAARLYEELLIKWVYPAAEANQSAKKMAGRRQKEHFLAIMVFSLHRPEDLGLGLLSSKNFKARLLDFACEQRDFERFGLSHHQMLKISAPLGTFYLTVDLSKFAAILQRVLHHLGT